MEDSMAEGSREQVSVPWHQCSPQQRGDKAVWGWGHWDMGRGVLKPSSASMVDSKSGHTVGSRLQDRRTRVEGGASRRLLPPPGGRDQKEAERERHSHQDFIERLWDNKRKGFEPPQKGRPLSAASGPVLLREQNPAWLTLCSGPLHLPSRASQNPQKHTF